MEEKQVKGHQQDSTQVDDEGGRFPLSMAFEDAILSVRLDMQVLAGAILRLLASIYFCVFVGLLLAGGTPTHKMFNQANAVTKLWHLRREVMPNAELTSSFGISVPLTISTRG